MKLEPLDIRNQVVQNFLWNHLEPADFRFDYTKLDAIKEVETAIYDGNMELWGDMSAGFAFRVVMRNPKVVEPHIMGDGSKIRTARDLGVDYAWSRGFEKIVINTQHDKIKNILCRLGFSLVACLDKLHMESDGELVDIYILVMEKP